MLVDWMDWLRAAEHLRTAEAAFALLDHERNGLARRVALRARISEDGRRGGDRDSPVPVAAAVVLALGLNEC